MRGRSCYKIFGFLLSASLYSSCSSSSDVSGSVSKDSVKTLDMDSLGMFGQGTLEKDLYYDIIIQNQPENDEAWAGKAVAYLKRGDLAEAFRCINQAVELDPLGHLGYRGWVKLYMLHDYEGALEDFHWLDTLTPNVQDAPWGEDIDKLQGICYLKLGQLERAEFHFRESIRELTKVFGKDWVEDEILIYLSITLRKRGKDTDALLLLNELLEESPTTVRALYEKAILLSQKDADLALNVLDSCEKNFQFQSTNPYFETPYQLYLSDLEELKFKIKTKNGN